MEREDKNMKIILSFGGLCALYIIFNLLNSNIFTQLEALISFAR